MSTASALRSGRTLLLAFVLATVPRPGGAVAAQAGGRAADPAASLDLDAALRLAAERSPTVASAAARATIARGSARELTQYPNPTIEYRRENLGSELLPDEFVTATLPLDVSGRRLAMRSARARALERVALDGTEARRLALLDVADAWVTATAARDVAAIRRAQADTLAALAAVEARRAREGAVAEGVAMRVRLEADRAALDAARADADAVRAAGRLAEQLGVSVESLPPLAPLPVADTLLDAPAPDTALVATALANRPLLAARRAARAEADAWRRAESRGVIGDWQLQGGTKTTSGFLTGQVALAVPLPLFHRNDGARERTTGQAREAAAALRAAELRVAADTRTAATTVRTLLAIAPAWRTATDRGREVAGIGTIAWVEGAGSLLELLDAQRIAADAAVAALGWRADLLRARLGLQVALGTPFAVEAAR